ncbi:MAG: hypothetical protein Q8N84_02215 [bacterium]|nr:hypothetical protein [bacterium]
MRKLLSAPLSSRKLVEYLLLFLLLASILSAAAYGGYWYGKQQATPPQTAAPKTKEPTPPKVAKEAAGWKSYTNEKYKFSFEYPVDYFPVSSESETNVSLTMNFSPTKDIQEADKWLTVFVDSLSGYTPGMTLEDWVNLPGNNEPTNKKVPVSVGEEKAYKVIVDSFPDNWGREASYSYSLHTLKGSYLYVLRLGFTSKEMFVKEEKLFDQILSTFRFLDQKAAEGSNAIQLEGLASGDSISSPLIIKGTVLAGWVFEGVFPIKLLDNQRKEITRALAGQVIPGDWSSGKERVAFKATLTFSTTATSGYLVFEADNPSGLSENAESFEVPVKFSQVADEAAGWKVCSSSELNISLKYPPSWTCKFTAANSTSGDTLTLKRSDGKKVDFFKVYGFGPSSDTLQGEKVEVAKVTLQGKNFGVYFWPSRTALPKIFEQMVYDEGNLKMIYISSSSYDSLSTSDKAELKAIFESLSTLQ